MLSCRRKKDAEYYIAGVGEIPSWLLNANKAYVQFKPGGVLVVYTDTGPYEAHFGTYIVWEDDVLYPIDKAEFDRLYTRVE